MSEFPNFQTYVRSLGTYYDDILAEIQKDEGDAPLCHWGTRHDSRVATTFAYLCSMLPELDEYDGIHDSLIGQVVNDSDGRLAATMMSLRHNWPDGLRHWLSAEEWLDDNAALKVTHEALQTVARKIWAVGAETEQGRLNPFIYTYEVLWDLVFEYWDDKED